MLNSCSIANWTKQVTRSQFAGARLEPNGCVQNDATIGSTCGPHKRIVAKSNWRGSTPECL